MGERERERMTDRGRERRWDKRKTDTDDIKFIDENEGNVGDGVQMAT